MRPIKHYRKEHSRLHARIDELEQAQASQDALIAAAVEAAVQPVRQQLLDRTKELATVQDNLQEELRGTKQEADRRAALIRSLREDVSAAHALADAQGITASKLALELATAQEHVTEANALVTSHLERMTKREQLKASQILNRKVMAEVAPAVDRRAR